MGRPHPEPGRSCGGHSAFPAFSGRPASKQFEINDTLISSSQAGERADTNSDQKNDRGALRAKTNVDVMEALEQSKKSKMILVLIRDSAKTKNLGTRRAQNSKNERSDT